MDTRDVPANTVGIPTLWAFVDAHRTEPVPTAWLVEAAAATTAFSVVLDDLRTQTKTT